MSAVIVVIVILGFGIFIGIKSGRLTVTEVMLCTAFGLLVGGTSWGNHLGLWVETGWSMIAARR